MSKIEEFEIVDTTTIEEPREELEWLGPRLQIVIGIALGILIFYKIAVTGSAFVDAPKWTIFDSPIGNAIYSGLVGVIENLVFFGILFSTALAVCLHYTDNPYLSFLIALVLTTFVFVQYHSWRYGFSETALLSVSVFSILNCIIIYTTKSIIISDIIHFTNNFAIGMGLATRIALAVIL